MPLGGRLGQDVGLYPFVGVPCSAIAEFAPVRGVGVISGYGVPVAMQGSCVRSRPRVDVALHAFVGVAVLPVAEFGPVGGVEVVSSVGIPIPVQRYGSGCLLCVHVALHALVGVAISAVAELAPVRRVEVVGGGCVPVAVQGSRGDRCVRIYLPHPAISGAGPQYSPGGIEQQVADIGVGEPSAERGPALATVDCLVHAEVGGDPEPLGVRWIDGDGVDG